MKFQIKMSFLKIPMFIAFLVLIFSSCKKDEVDTVVDEMPEVTKPQEIQVVDSLLFVETFTRSGTGVGEVNIGSGWELSTDGQSLFVADFGNKRIQRFDDGKFQDWLGVKNGQFGLNTEGKAEDVFQLEQVIPMQNYISCFVRLQSKWYSYKIDLKGNIIDTVLLHFDSKDFRPMIAIDKSGNFFALQDHNLFKFNSKGNLMKKFGGFGSGEGQLSKASLGTGLALDSKGYLYVCDRGQDRINKYDNDGNFITSLSAEFFNDAKRAITIIDDVIYYFSKPSYAISRLDLDGKVVGGKIHIESRYHHPIVKIGEYYYQSYQNEISKYKFKSKP